jgi:hypothetical protein
MYLIHKQSGYFNSIAKVVEEVLDDEYMYSNDPNQDGVWVLFFTSFLSGFHTKIKSPYILIQTELKDRTFKRYPEYKQMYDKALKILDFAENFQVGYSNSYREYCENAKDIDVLFYGVLSERRKKLLESLDVDNKVILSKSPPIWGNDLWKYINRSKIVLNISAYENRFEPDWIRLAPLLSNKTFVITEKVGDPEFLKLKHDIIMVDYSDMKQTVHVYLKDPIKRAIAADRGFDFIRKRQNTIVK